MQARGAHRHRQIACLLPGPFHTSHLVPAEYFCQLLLQSAVQATVVHWQLQSGSGYERCGRSTKLQLLAEHTHEVSALLTLQASYCRVFIKSVAHTPTRQITSITMQQDKRVCMRYNKLKQPMRLVV